MRVKTLCAAVAPCLFLLSLSSGAEPVTTDAGSSYVAIRSGTLRGVRVDAVESFKGIPYAAAPIGSLRWRPPQPIEPWNEIRPATAYGNDCLQNRFPFDSTPSFEPLSEDCLYLNVWAPVKRINPAAVLVWIHGGGLKIGSGSAPVFDGTALARKGVILVTLNYRLGRFGFFAHPALMAEHSDEAKGNYGLMDQIAALKWVQENIQAFGGDPSNVTVFGQSSGGVSVLHLMASAQARGLFAKAIVLSGGGREHWARMNEAMDDRFSTHVSALDAGLIFAKKVGIKDTDSHALDALRALPADKVLGDAGFIGGDESIDATPMIDGTVVSQDVDETFRAGTQASVPLLIGTTDDELGGMPGFMLRKMKKRITPRFGAYAAGLSAYYQSETSRPADLLNDTGFVEPARYLARKQAVLGVPVWRYRFSYVATSARTDDKGAGHASELPYVFGTLDKAPPILSTTRMITYWLASKIGIHLGKARVNSADDYKMSDVIQDTWIAFAQTGNPNHPGIAEWPSVMADPSQLMIFSNDGVQAAEDPIQDRLDYITQSYSETAPK